MAGVSPESDLNSLLPSQYVLGLPWVSFCLHPSQLGQPRNAGPALPS